VHILDQLIGDSLEGASGRILWGVIQIILMLLGNIGQYISKEALHKNSIFPIGNVLTLIVLNRRLMRKGGVNNLLQGLAISDIVAPTLACIPHIIYYYGPKNNGKLISFVNSFLMPLATGATFSSNWIGNIFSQAIILLIISSLVVTITCFRLMIVVKPLYSQVYCSSRNERKALILICVCSILSIIPYYYYRSNIDALNVLKVVSAVLALLCPWVICVFLWILLIRIVNREIGSKKSKEFILHSEIVAQRLKSKSRMTKMVLIICFFNIICQLPVLILTIYGLIDGNPCGYLRAIIFFIYSLTNCKFRYTLKIMCRHCCFFHDCVNNRTLTQRQMMTYDDQRKITNQKLSPKYDCNSCSNSKSRESPRLMVTMRGTNSAKLTVNNTLSSGRVAL
jgi:hypothetical protein